MLISEVFERRYVAEEAETIVLDGKRWMVYIEAVVEIWRTVYPGDSATPDVEDREVGEWWIKELSILPEDGDVTDPTPLVESCQQCSTKYNPDEVFEAIVETSHFRQWINEVSPNE